MNEVLRQSTSVTRTQSMQYDGHCQVLGTSMGEGNVLMNSFISALSIAN
jgi:hypothetical protein